MERRRGDWDCPNCNEMNFASRTQCRRCGTAHPGIPPGTATPAPIPTGSSQVLKPGDWICPGCSDHNFASREACRKCGTARPLSPTPLPYGYNYYAPTFKPGDWYCPHCNDHNFASRDVCRKCSTPRPAGGTPAPPTGAPGAPLPLTPPVAIGFGMPMPQATMMPPHLASPHAALPPKQ